MSCKIVCLGAIVADLQLKPVNTFPEPGALAMVDNMVWNTGGCALNTAVALRKLGEDVSLAGCVGDDMIGHWIIEECIRFQIAVSGISKAEGITSTSVVLISSNGERSFLHCPGANSMADVSMIDFRQFADAGFAYIGGVYGLKLLDEKLEEVVLKIKLVNPDIKIVMDVIYSRDVSDSRMIDSVLPYIDYFVPNLQEAHRLSRKKNLLDIGDYFVGKGVSNLIITMGKKGVFFYQKGNCKFFKPFKVKVIDETGAGDAFAAGLLSSLCRGASIADSIEFGNAVGALSVTKMGASDGVVSRESTNQFILKQKGLGVNSNVG